MPASSQNNAASVDQAREVCARDGHTGLVALKRPVRHQPEIVASLEAHGIACNKEACADLVLSDVEKDSYLFFWSFFDSLSDTVHHFDMTLGLLPAEVQAAYVHAGIHETEQ
eukprot:CAMPEP_0172787144 /NCGR_PEP_ID=MMETSP1074-20121228/206304_1 /TAXON_ID=2916 /ORGANISM="Ceratium fusus, Strain PA161109" /LENGTH=111 /DNA_ID=CAMNT_0013624165 /DNA_START=1252 /DNA_END=1587 /DNA_ORIENTATION=-